MPHDNHQGRLLALTEAHAIARHLLAFTAQADDLARETHLPGHADTLPAATEAMLSDAIDLYTYNATSAAGHSPDEYAKAALPAALGRVERLAALGHEIANTANRLHTALEAAADDIIGGAAPTPAEIRERIREYAAQLGTDTAPTQAELVQLWTDTRPTPGKDEPIDLATSNDLRIHFDRMIIDNPGAPEWSPGPGYEALDRTVARWRSWYLEHEADWSQYGTWLYAAVHETNWGALDELWDRVVALQGPDPKDPDDRGPHFTGAERIALRDAIAAHIRARATRPSIHDDAYSLWCKVTEYDTDSTALAFRIRLATDVAQATAVFDLIRGQWEKDGVLLPLLTSAARKATELAGLADTTDAINARVQVKAWRNDLFDVATSYANGDTPSGRGGRHKFTPDQVSSLLYYAVTTFRHADDVHAVADLLAAGHTACAAHRITLGDYEKLAIIANPTTRTEGDNE